MSSLLGFIQLLLVLVPIGKKQHKSVITEQQQITTHTAVIVVVGDGSTSNRILLPLPVAPSSSPATSQDDKGIPATPFTLLDFLFTDQSVSGQLLSNKPFRKCALYILYCQLKSDC